MKITPPDYTGKGPDGAPYGYWHLLNDSGYAVAYIFGDAPKATVDAIAEMLDAGPEFNYLQAFERFSENYGEILGDRDPQEILAEIR